MQNLKYTFTAQFADGSIIVQDADDRSTLDPEKRSAFFDVCEKQKESALVHFKIEGEGHTYAVDLMDGHFEVDGVPFKMIDGYLPEYRIVYYRRRKQHLTMGVDGSNPVERDGGTEYCFGWQCTLDGKNYQRVMEID